MNTAHNPIRVLVVDDSSFMRLTIQKILSKDPDIKIVDVARDGCEGIEKLQALRPDVVTMDVEMPVMDGLQALDEIMRWQPTPVIVLSAVTTEGAEATLKALDLGAFDVVAKPTGGVGADLQALAAELADKVKAAAGVELERLKRGSSGNATSTDQKTAKGVAVAAPADGRTEISTVPQAWPKHPIEIVAIGTSTGGPSALQTVLPRLPADFPVPIVVAQHMPPGFTGPLAQRLNGICSLTIREGVHGEVLKPGTVYVAPAGKQTQIQRKAGQLVLDISDKSPIQTLYRPSLDVLFLSLAKAVGSGVLGVVMTGMGSDGLRGMQEIKALSGFAVAEAEETCVVYGMPRAIVDNGLADRITPLGDIGKTIVECVLRREIK